MRIIALTVTTAVTLSAASNDIVNFDKAEMGKPPAGWTATQTGSGQAKWEIVRDDTAPSKPNAETVRSSHLPGLPEGRHEHQGRIR